MRDATISIFTPTNDTRFLRDAYQSIREQSFEEWILVYNGGAEPIDFHDPRVKSHFFPDSNGSVGALKARACSLSSGDLLVELDSDDLLAPNALAEIRKAFEEDPEVSLVYSNMICVDAGLEPLQMSEEKRAQHGWRLREVQYRGRPFEELRYFPPTTESIVTGTYWPDHVRAYRASTYRQVGGHDPSLDTCEDSELSMRFARQTKLRHIDLPLYVYRIHSSNTSTHRHIDNDLLTLIVDAHREPIIERWAADENLPVLHFASLGQMAALADSSVGVVRAGEAFAESDDPVRLMREVHRVLVPGGWLLAHLPISHRTARHSTGSRVAYFHFWDERTCSYFADRFVNVRSYEQGGTVTMNLLAIKDGFLPCGPCYNAATASQGRERRSRWKH